MNGGALWRDLVAFVAADRDRRYVEAYERAAWMRAPRLPRCMAPPMVQAGGTKGGMTRTYNYSG